MIDSNAAIRAWADSERETPTAGMEECPQEQCHEGRYTQQTWPLHKTTACIPCHGTGRVRAPCATCGGGRLVGEQPWRRGDGGYLDPADDEREPCPDCTDGLAPRVGPEIDLTPRRPCSCAADDWHLKDCPAQCDEGRVGWDERPKCTACKNIRFTRGGRDNWSQPERCRECGPPDLTPILKPRVLVATGITDCDEGPTHVPGHGPPLVDVLPVRVEDEKNLPRYLASHIAPWCAEVGVTLEVREVE